jgi:hypothetical protein
MASRANKFIFICATLLLTTVSLGIRSCAEPKEYCSKFYQSGKDQSDCTEYCENNKDYVSQDHKDLVDACQAGQLLFIENPKHSAEEALLQCDRQTSEKKLQQACHDGVTAEELRYAKTHKGPGTATDRETGNNR